MDMILVLRVVGSLLIILGISLFLSLNTIFNFIIQKELSLSPVSRIYNSWKENVQPMYMDAYMLNCTNSKEAVNKNYVPEFEEIGPYRFKEFHEKVNVTWNENNTVTYKQVRRWHFDPVNSYGSLDDIFTTPNPISLSASFMSKSWSSVYTVPLSAALRSMQGSIWVSKPVGQVLFDGYTDPLLSLVYQIPMLASLNLPSDKIGQFYQKNGTTLFDGVINMNTRVPDNGIVRNWNYRNTSHAYGGACGDIGGSTGELFPPGRKKEDGIEIFAPELCTKVKLDFLEDTEVFGIPGNRYSISKDVYKNDEEDPDRQCFCGDRCFPPGILNISECMFGAPLFASNPHFFEADPSYLSRVKGLNPDPDKHRFHFTLEPKTGAPLLSVVRVQVNIFLENNPKITMFQHMPTMMFPVMWFEKRASIPQEMITPLKMILLLPSIGLYISIVLIVLGHFFLVLTFTDKTLNVLNCILPKSRERIYLATNPHQRKNYRSRAVLENGTTITSEGNYFLRPEEHNQ